MITSLPTPASPPAAAGAGPSRRPSLGGARPRSSEAPDAPARAFQDHLTESSAPDERRPDAAQPTARNTSAEPTSDDAAEAGAAVHDEERDPTAAGGSTVLVLPPEVTIAALPGMPAVPANAETPANGGTLHDGTEGGDAAGDDRPAPLLATENGLATASRPADTLNDFSEPPRAVRLPASLLNELPANLATQLGEPPDTAAGAMASAEPAAPPADPATPAVKTAAGTPDKSESHASGPVPGEQSSPAHPTAPPAAGAVATGSQPAAEPADAGQLATGRAAIVTLPDLPARLARLAGRVLESGPSEVRLRLDPPSLGELRIHVGRDANGIHVRIVAQSHETLALLDNSHSRLREELERSGLVLESFSTALDDGRQTGADPWAGNLYGNPQDSARPGAPGSSAEPTAPPLTADASGRAPGRQRGLDARA